MNEKLKELRKEMNLSQKAVAKVLGITLSSYSNYEQGIREHSIEMIKKLCEFFKVTSDYLIGLED